jgi:NADP-dependent 3-hydroxy acid dehydrogenase YdfG
VKADSMNDGISGKGVLFTGASSGLGEALARHRAPVGAKLVPGARRLDVIIDHAGPMPFSQLARLKVEDGDRTIDVDIEGVLHGLTAARPHMPARRSGLRHQPTGRRGRRRDPAQADEPGIRINPA